MDTDLVQHVLANTVMDNLRRAAKHSGHVTGRTTTLVIIHISASAGNKCRKITPSFCGAVLGGRSLVKI
jgi:hypothetical protein